MKSFVKSLRAHEWASLTIVFACSVLYVVTHDTVVQTSFSVPVPEIVPVTIPKTVEANNEWGFPNEISHGDTSKKQVIFTFDGGSGTQSFNTILSALSKHGVKGTFFITGKWIESHPELIMQLIEQGHEVFNHTYSHPYLTQTSDEEIVSEFSKTEKLFAELTGSSTHPYFRPPYGDRSSHVLSVAGKNGYQSAYWSIDALDWREGITAAEVRERILTHVTPGAIYLMHIGDTITGDILDDVFSSIENQGYEIVSLTQGL